jgi:phosphoserine aminotransferase
MAQLMSRPWNFGAGPATLPEPVLARVRDEIFEIPGLGLSPLEASHRSSWFEGVIHDAEANIRALLGVPDSHAIVFCQGGGSMQFSMVALNLAGPHRSRAAYVVTGSWAEKAFSEANRLRPAEVIWTGRDGGYRRVPTPDEVPIPPEAAYVHMTSNETIQGVEWPDSAEPSAEVLVCDGSSDFLSRPLDISRFGILYAGAQKNAGPAGTTVVIVRRDLLDRIPDRLPLLLDYRTYADEGSLYNTPPVFSIYVISLVTSWLKEEVGGLRAQHELNGRKAKLLYDRIDAGFYIGHAEPASRSLMNVTFRLPTSELESAFLKEAEAEGMLELKGHRSVGGIRASIYNAMPLEGVEALAQLMHDFARRNG